MFGTTLGTAVGGPVGAALGAGVGVLVYQRRSDDAVQRGEAEHARVVEMSGGQAAYDAFFDRMERRRVQAEAAAAAVEYGQTKDHIAEERAGRSEYLRLGVQTKTRAAVKATGRARDMSQSRPVTGVVSQKVAAKG